MPASRSQRVQQALDLISRWQRRHALLLFLAFGAALFAADHLRRLPAPPPGESADAQWLEDEVLYREALARGLGEGDLIVRRRLVQKMRLLLETGVDVAEPDDATLAAWIDAHAARYGGVARLWLDHFFLSRGRHGAALDEAAAALQAQLPPGPATALGDPHPGGVQLDGLDPRTLERTFGTLLAERISALSAGAWHGPLPSALGLHFVRVRSRELQTPDYAAVRERARRDYLVERRREGTRLALDELLRRHGIAAGTAP